MKCIYCGKEVTEETQGFEKCADVCMECAINMVGIDKFEIEHGVTQETSRNKE